MITPQELRIGCHYINTMYDYIGKVTHINYNFDDVNVVLEWDIDYDETSDPFEAVNLSYLHGVPITEELLEKIGFEKVLNNWRNKDFTISKACGNRWIVNTIGFVSCCPVEYLHELEQYVFITTKKELI